MRGLRLLFGLVVLLTVVSMRPAAATERSVTVNANGPATTPYQFAPATRNVEAGDSVIWNNSTAVPHTATADDGSFNVSIPSGPGTSSSPVTIEGATRDVTYHCSIHPYMHGVIHVSALVVVSTTTTTRPTTTTTRPTSTTSRATTTSRVSSTTSSTFTTETLALDTTTSEETTTTAGQVALKTSGGGTNAGAVAVLVVAIGAILGGGGYLLYRLRSGRF